MLLMCTYNLETSVLNVNSMATFAQLLDKIRSSWPAIDVTCLKIYYKVPNYQRCLLRNDGDIHNMILVAESLKIDRLHMDLVREVANCVVSENNSVIVMDVNIPVEENDPHLISSDDSAIENICVSLGWDNIVLEEGGRFVGGAAELRLVLQKISLHTGFQYVYHKNDKNRITAVCAMKKSTKCGWFVHATKAPVNGFFYIRRLSTIHTCGSFGRSFEGSRLTSALVSTIIHDIIRDTPAMGPGYVRRHLAVRGLRCSYDTAKAGVVKAKSAIWGDIKKSFNRLPAYIKAIKESNPGSKVELESDPKTKRFKRLFVAFNASIQGFTSCRPLIFLDGAHLKTQYKGHLLAATGKDADQGMYPICFAVVDSENHDNWEWFLTHMKSILAPDRRITFMSDRNSGIVDGIATVFPTAFHGFCLYHLKLNLRTALAGKKGSDKYHRDRMVRLLEECAYTTSVQVYNQKINQLRLEGGEGVQTFLDNLQPENWANAFFQGNRYGHTCSTIAESFNSWVREERCLPVATMVDLIRVKLMNLWAVRREECQSWTIFVSPYIDAQLCEAMDRGRNWNVVSSTRFRYEVQSSPRTIVDLFNFTCSCTRWQRQGYPCPHAAAAIMKTGYAMHQFVDPYFLTSNYAASYEHPIYPVPDSYEAVDSSDVIFLLPNKPRNQPGRPKKTRIPSRGESSRPKKCARRGKDPQDKKKKKFI